MLVDSSRETVDQIALESRRSGNRNNHLAMDRSFFIVCEIGDRMRRCITAVGIPRAIIIAVTYPARFIITLVIQAINRNR